MRNETRVSKFTNTFCKILAEFGVTRFAGHVLALDVETNVMNVEMPAKNHIYDTDRQQQFQVTFLAVLLKYEINNS